MVLSLDMRFTEAAAPLFVDVEGDCTQGLFVIATNQPPGAPAPTNSNNHRQMVNKKRDREETPADNQRPKRSMKVVQKVDADTASVRTSQSRQSSRVPSSMPPPSFPGSLREPPVSVYQPSQPLDSRNTSKQEPLFLPSSQFSVAENNFLKDAGLGDIETMEELNALLEGDGDEVDFSSSQEQRVDLAKRGQEDNMHVDETPESFELIDDEPGFEPTQAAQKVCVCSIPCAIIPILTKLSKTRGSNHYSMTKIYQTSLMREPSRTHNKYKVPSPKKFSEQNIINIRVESIAGPDIKFIQLLQNYNRTMRSGIAFLDRVVYIQFGDADAQLMDWETILPSSA